MSNEIETYANNHKNGELEQYVSMIPNNIMSRDAGVLEYTVLLGIERVDLPKMASGATTTWWYLVQLKTCKSCVFLSQRLPEFPYRDCTNPKISPVYFDIVSRGLSLCTAWHAGFDDDRIDDEVSFGYAENRYVFAALIKMGLTDTPKNLPIPTIGSVDMLKFSIELATAADIHNSIVFSYLQMTSMARSGKDIDEEYFSQLTNKKLPKVQGDKFNTNLLL